MAKILAAATMSLDGYIALPDNTIGHLFDWMGSGDVAVTSADPARTFHTSQASADYIEQEWSRAGVSIIGRTLFDFVNGWDGVPPVGDHIVVVTHTPPTDWPFPDAPFTFVSDFETALATARDLAGDRDIVLNSGTIAGQGLAAGVIDEVHVSLAPVVLGQGKRFFGDFAGPETVLDNPRIIVGDRVTHLVYRVQRG